tara:strand:+ start:126 stop:560 length:435 start_codon:yes stop_codon:yes gene_type:complete
VPEELNSPVLASTFHLIEAATRMHLASMGQMATCVLFEYKKKTKMTLYKGDAALAARRAVASKLDHRAISALRRPMHVDKPDWTLMQQLSDAGIGGRWKVERWWKVEGGRWKVARRCERGDVLCVRLERDASKAGKGEVARCPL